MSISTLAKFTVPLNTDANASSQSLLMPKLQYRFRVTLINFGISASTTELTKQVVDVTRPNLTFEEIVLDVYNSKVYLAGKPSWEAITLTVREDASANVQRLVGEQVQKQFDFFEQASARAGIDYKFKSTIEILDGGNGITRPEVLESFELYGCYLGNVNYNTLAYSTSDPVTVTLSIRYDNAIQTAPAGVGIGSKVPRGTGVLSTGGGVGPGSGSFGG